MKIVADYAEWRTSGYVDKALDSFPDLSAFSAAMGERHPLRLSADIGRYLAEPAQEEWVAVVATVPEHRVVTACPPANDNPLSPEFLCYRHEKGTSWVETGVEGFASTTGLKLHAPRLVAIAEGMSKTSPDVTRRIYVLASVHKDYWRVGGGERAMLFPLGSMLQYVNRDGANPLSVLTAIATADTDGENWALSGRTPFFMLRA